MLLIKTDFEYNISELWQPFFQPQGAKSDHKMYEYMFHVT